jgi:hypothetical protein
MPDDIKNALAVAGRCNNFNEQEVYMNIVLKL